MTRWRRAWVPALRMARREALRARGRSVLIVVMIALPVAAVVGLDVVARTASVSTVEGLDRSLGHADALVMWQGNTAPLDQSPTLSTVTEATAPDGATPPALPAPTQRTVTDALSGSRVVEVREGDIRLTTAIGRSRPTGVELDLRKPITRGLYDLTSGRYPASTDEVLVSGRLAQRGFTPGRLVSFTDGSRAQVVGLVESTATHDLNLVVGLPGSLPLPPDEPRRSWLVDAPGGVSWDQVRALNTHGVSVLSRRVVEDPPPASQVTVPDFGSSGLTGPDLAVLSMIVAMALLEVVLLAGPAFAVGVKRQERSLALMAATGGEPPDIRKVVLASGVVLGALAGATGLLVGVAGSWVALPLVQTFSSERFGPFQVVPREVLAIAACGVLSALAAALVPAVMASRQDVVAVLAGRRGQLQRPVWSPIAGALLLALGIAGAVAGARRPSGGEFLITGSAVLSVLGMVLLIPLVVAQLGRIARPLPLPLRFAVRDAARQRARTAPAVAAVAAVVAGVVALGVGGTSDAAERKATYSPGAPAGAAIVTVFDSPDAPRPAWSTVRAAVQAQVPAARIRSIAGLVDEQPDSDPADTWRSASVTLDGPSDAGSTSYSSSYGSSYLVGQGSLQRSGIPLSRAERARATDVLSRGGVVLLGYRSRAVATARVEVFRNTQSGAEPVRLRTATVPATVVTVPGSVLPASAVLSEAAARGTGLPVRTSALLVRGAAIDQATEDRMQEAVAGLSDYASVYVERGYHDNSIAVALLILGFAGGVLVLGGTLTATFLALSDARPDFATMGAVGAGPRTRRTVAGAYALTVGAVGAVLGAAVGFIPGIAVTYPLTGNAGVPDGGTDASGVPLPDHFLDVPWGLISSLVVGLPLFAALVVVLATRSRLPMVSRLS